jgi:hypothetical protein
VRLGAPPGRIGELIGVKEEPTEPIILLRADQNNAKVASSFVRSFQGPLGQTHTHKRRRLCCAVQHNAQSGTPSTRVAIIAINGAWMDTEQR